MASGYSGRVLIIFNPIAGAGRRRRLGRALAWLQARDVGHDVAETRAPGDAESLARDATRRGVRVVVAAGGDGTIAEVAAGLAGGASRLGILPLGTANVLAWELGVPAAPERAAEVLATGRSAELWPGVAQIGNGRAKLFVQMVGAGFDAAVVAHLDPVLKWRIGRAAYVWQSLREMPRHRFAPVTVDLDGTPHRAASVIVTKGRLYAGRYCIAPDARPAEPGFQVVMFQRPGMMQAMLAGAALPLGLIPRLPGVQILPARRVLLSARGDVAVQADGDAIGSLPIRIADAARPLTVLLP